MIEVVAERGDGGALGVVGVVVLADDVAGGAEALALRVGQVDGGAGCGARYAGSVRVERNAVLAKSPRIAVAVVVAFHAVGVAVAEGGDHGGDMAERGIGAEVRGGCGEFAVPMAFCRVVIHGGVTVGVVGDGVERVGDGGEAVRVNRVVFAAVNAVVTVAVVADESRYIHGVTSSGLGVRRGAVCEWCHRRGGASMGFGVRLWRASRIVSACQGLRIAAAAQQQQRMRKAPR